MHHMSSASGVEFCGGKGNTAILTFFKKWVRSSSSVTQLKLDGAGLKAMTLIALP